LPSAGHRPAPRSPSLPRGPRPRSLSNIPWPLPLKLPYLFYIILLKRITLFNLLKIALEIRGFSFQSAASCRLLPARLRNPAASMRRIPQARH
jgi:hypothetical protein